MRESFTDTFIDHFSLLMKLGRPKRYGSYTRGEMCILNYLYDQSEPVQPGELSLIMDASSARVAAVLKRLEGKGLIGRNIDVDDRRRILVCITPQGRRLVESRRGEMRNYIAEIIDRLGEEDVREGLRILARIKEIAEQLETDGQTVAAAETERIPHE